MVWFSIVSTCTLRVFRTKKRQRTKQQAGRYRSCDSQIKIKATEETLMAALSSNKEENSKDIQHSANIKEETEGPAVQMSETPDVPCDSCMDSPSKAVKSCLTCLVSYCEAHLRPHLENTKFQNHRLVDPLRDIDCRICDVHHLPLERFCLVDGCCVCLDCERQEHEGHTIAPAGEARTQIEV